MKNNYLFDLGAEIVTEKDFDDITVPEFVQAILKRLANVIEHNDLEAFGWVDQYEEDE